MIIKIKSRKKPSYKQLLEYILDKDRHRLLNPEDQSFLITHNLKGKNIEQWVKQFQNNETYRLYKHKNKNYLTHEIISFHKEDVKNITLSKMEDIAKEYIHLRNPNGVYAAVPHFDKEHYHIHICVSALEYKSGKSLRMSKDQFKDLKKNIQLYQKEKYPELSKSIVEHENKGKVKITDKEYQMKLRTGRATDKEKVIEMLNNCFKQANSEKDFLLKVKEAGIKTYDRSGKTTGLIFGKHKFRFNRLGFTKEKTQELNKVFNREKELSELREKSKGRNIERNR
jgi:hypothetical protein